MSGKMLSPIRETARQFLRDEFQAGVDMAFEDDELDLHINEVVTEISGKSPYEVRETVEADGTSEIDLSEITGLIGDKVEKVEYPTGAVPRSFLTDFSIFGDILTLNTEPTSGEDIYLYCHKVHELTESSTSLSPDLEKVLVEGVVAKVALSWVNQIRVQIASAIITVDSLSTAIGSMDARITQAIADLVSGRALIGSKKTEANTAIGNMSARVTAAIGDLTTGRALIGQKRTNAITAIDAMTSQLTVAIGDLTSGRAKIADERTAMDMAIDNMTARITQAMADLTTGRTLINKVNIGGAPEDDYARYASVELGNAAQYLNQSRGYLSEATTSDRYANYAVRDISVAIGYLNQARAYLSTDTVTTEYGNYAARELSNANAYLAQARGYLAVDQPAMEYGNYAARELANATAYLNKAGGYFRKLTAQLNVAASMTRYQAWAKDQFAIYQRSLNSVIRPRAWKY